MHPPFLQLHYYSYKQEQTRAKEQYKSKLLLCELHSDWGVCARACVCEYELIRM